MSKRFIKSLLHGPERDGVVKHGEHRSPRGRHDHDEKAPQRGRVRRLLRQGKHKYEPPEEIAHVFGKPNRHRRHWEMPRHNIG